MSNITDHEHEEKITLNCFVFGDHPTELCQVEIGKTRILNVLKDEIRVAQQAFQEVQDVTALHAYRLTAPIPKADIKTKLAIHLDPADVPGAEELLSKAWAKMSNLFPSPTEEDVHVIVARSSAGEYKPSLNDFDLL